MAWSWGTLLSWWTATAAIKLMCWGRVVHSKHSLTVACCERFSFSKWVEILYSYKYIKLRLQRISVTQRPPGLHDVADIIVDSAGSRSGPSGFLRKLRDQGALSERCFSITLGVQGYLDDQLRVLRNISMITGPARGIRMSTLVGIILGVMAMSMDKATVTVGVSLRVRLRSGVSRRILKRSCFEVAVPRPMAIVGPTVLTRPSYLKLSDMPQRVTQVTSHRCWLSNLCCFIWRSIFQQRLNPRLLPHRDICKHQQPHPLMLSWCFAVLGRKQLEWQQQRGFHLFSHCDCCSKGTVKWRWRCKRSSCSSSSGSGAFLVFERALWQIQWILACIWIHSVCTWVPDLSVRLI